MTALSDKAYAHIYQQIASGDLAPGAVVSESVLARNLGMSRTPVGEAVRQLAYEGLVEQVPRFGTIVRNVTPQEVVELYEMREALEGYAAGRAAERIGKATLAKLKVLCSAMQQLAQQCEDADRAALDQAELSSFLSADMAFHMLILEASGNQRILKSVTEAHAISDIFRTRRQRHTLEVIEATIEQHRGILAALQQGSASEATSAMTEHITTSRLQAVREMQQQATAQQAAGSLPANLPATVVSELERIEREGVC